MNNDYTTVKKLYYGNDLVNIAVGNAEVEVPSALTSWSVDEWGKPTSIVVKEGQTEIQAHWQYYNDSLTSCTLPNSITKIGLQAFSYAGNNMTINIPSGLTNVGSSVFQHSSINCDLTIPYGSISAATSGYNGDWESGFDYASFNYNTVNIESGATIIPRQMFRNNKNVTIIVPSSVTFLSPSCFALNASSSNIIIKFLGNTPPDASSWTYSSSNCPFYVYDSSYLNNLTILVPISKVTTYKNKFGTTIGARIQGY